MMKFIRISILLILLLLIQKICDSQELYVTFHDTGKSSKLKLPANKRIDSSLVAITLKDYIQELYKKGYLSASIDSFEYDSTSVKAYGENGLKYRWIRISPDSIANLTFNDLGIRIPKSEGKLITPLRISKLSRTIIGRLEDSGYPFARIKLDSVKILKNKVEATLFLDKGSRIVFDTLYIKGDASIKHSYIEALLAIRKGAAYSETRVKQVDRRLKQQPYLSIIKPTEVEFLPHKARLYCYLSNRSASNFSGIAGFYTDDKDSKIKLSGDLNLSLMNKFHNGEKLNFTWKAPGKGTQNLNIETDWPYIFKSQIGISGGFSLYKHDSTYITINPKVSLNFFTSIGGRFLLNLDYKKTSFSSIDQTQKMLYANSTALLYGVGYEFKNYNQPVLPSQGFYFKGTVNTGNRKVDSSKGEKSNLLEAEIFAESYLPIYESWLILNLRSNSKIREVYNTNGSLKLFENEMYRIGGLSTIRGFNQEGVLASAYSIASAEIHVRVAEGSGFFLFIDKGFVKAYEQGIGNDSWPLGLGVGLNMVTKAGLFNLSYAVGDGFGQSFSVRDAKVHFGILAVF